MKRLPTARVRPLAGFTLIELLTVIAIIGVLAGMLMPAIINARVKAKITVAKNDMSIIKGAINSYQTTYSRMPTSKRTRDSITETCPDFTFGTVMVNDQGSPLPGGTLLNIRGQQLLPILNAGTANNWQYNNSELVAVLRNVDRFADGRPTVNPLSSLNPQKQNFIDGIKDVNYQRKAGSGGPATYRGGGVGPDGVVRDPFGNPYIITLDMNFDGLVRDAFYRMQSVSADPKPGEDISRTSLGFNGLRRSPANGPGDTTPNRFEIRDSVSVWSLGPDGQANANIKANVGVNKDNVLSWK